MPHFEIISLFALVLFAWFWLDSLTAREIGIEAVRKVCEEESLQLLDETIAVNRIRLARNGQGRLVWQRVYVFEFSDTGNNRRQGSVHLMGHRVVMLNVGLRLASLDGKLL